jgi:hypothetical protein
MPQPQKPAPRPVPGASPAQLGLPAQLPGEKTHDIVDAFEGLTIHDPEGNVVWDGMRDRDKVIHPSSTTEGAKDADVHR